MYCSSCFSSDLGSSEGSSVSKRLKAKTRMLVVIERRKVYDCNCKLIEVSSRRYQAHDVIIIMLRFTCIDSLKVNNRASRGLFEPP